MPDAKTIWAFRERLTQADAINGLFARFEDALREAGYIAMGGQLVDSTLVAAPKHRNFDDEKKAIKAGKSAKQIRPGKPNKARQKDVNAWWTVQFGKARTKPDGTKPLDIAIPSFGYKAHTTICKSLRFIRRWDVSDASRHDGRFLRRGLLDRKNTGSGVWADSAYRSKQNEALMETHGFASNVHRRKQPANPCPHISGGAMRPAQNTAYRLSMSLPIKRPLWG
ncbi:transposase [Roseibium sp.]|uniref:transposase n=1 Tax=Roseibium sp. TaxID=1936156 RepID=UPI003B503D74